MNQQLAYLNQLKMMTDLYQFMVKLCWLKAMLDAQNPTEDACPEPASPDVCSKEKSASGAKKSAAGVHRGKSPVKSLRHQEKSEVSTMVASGCIKGRMYDFNNGRFLSVDPFIQGVTSQAINPYSYVQNNPLAGVDPTGYACEDADDSGEDCSPEPKKEKKKRKRAAAGVWGVIQVYNGGSDANGSNDESGDTSDKGSNAKLGRRNSNKFERQQERDRQLQQCKANNPEPCKGSITVERINALGGTAAGKGAADRINPDLVESVTVNDDGSITIKVKVYAKGDKKTVRNSLREIRREWGRQKVNIITTMVGSPSEADIVLHGASLVELVEACVAASCDAATGVAGIGYFKGPVLIINTVGQQDGTPTAAHEFGHKLGLRHRDRGIMAYPNPEAGLPNEGKRVTPADVQRLRELYDE